MAGALAACMCAVPAHSATQACQDFWQFANADWIAAHPRPPDQPRYGVLDVVAEHNAETSRRILEADAANPAASGDSKKIGDLYAACMDERSVTREGLSPLSPYLQLTRTERRAQILLAITDLHRIGIDVFWDATSGIDAQSGVREIAVIEPSRPRRTDPVQVTAQFALAGETANEAARDARSVSEIEAALTRVPLLDDDFHLIARAQLSRVTPGLPPRWWDGYFRSRGFPPFAELNVAQPDYLRTVDRILGTAPAAELGAYLRWRLLDSYAPWLPGVAAQTPRWKRCVQLVDQSLGDALGRQWVARAFSPEAEFRAQAMVDNIVTSLRRDIQHLPWMSAATRRQALVKLALMQIKIGYPHHWRSYASVTIDRASLFGDIQKAEAAKVRFAIAKIGKPPEPGEFLLTPQTVNAYYSPARNEIVVPAGILQPPIFDAGPDADDAMNYGGIGSIIGHELTHAFDDVGRRYDEHGALRDWWTPEDATAFTIRAQCFANQFSPSQAGEAIADLGGVSLAYAAFERVNAGKARLPTDGPGPEQRFFLGFANVWASSTSSDRARTEAASDPHPPDIDRVNKTLTNFPEFAQAFGCESSDAMVKPAAQRCGLW